MTRPLFVLGGAVLALAVLAVAWWTWGLRRDERLREVWRQEIFQGLEPSERFPPRQRNDTALVLEGLAAEMGIDFSVGDRKAAAPSEEASSRWDRVYELLQEHQWALRASTVDRTPALSSELSAFVEEHGESLARVRELLLTKVAPRWESDIERGAEAPIPDFIAQLQVHRLLQVLAHRALDAGDEATATAFLEAAWRLGRDPAENPVMIAQLIRLLEVGEELLVLRRFCSLDANWRHRLESLDLRAGVLRALQLEGWAMQSAQLPLGDDVILSPTYQRLMFLPLGEAVQRSVERLRTDPRILDIDAFTQEQYERIPRWARLSRAFFPQLFHAWPKTIRTELVVEHALHILEARRRLAREQAPISSRRPSEAAPGLFWLEEPSATGVRITLDGEFKDGENHPIALDFTIAGATCPSEVGTIVPPGGAALEDSPGSQL